MIHTMCTISEIVVESVGVLRIRGARHGLEVNGKKLCPIQIDPVGRILWTRRRGGSQKTAIYTSNLYCFNDLFKF
jgi:hypothetical protein